MGKFNEILKTVGSSRDPGLAEIWAEQFPLSGEGFFPPPGKASGTFESPRFSCTIFAEGSKLKLVFGSQDHPRKLWLTLSGPEGVLEQLEIALRTGQGEWRDSKEAK